MSTRRRLTADESREAALAAARDLLIEAGPGAVTLKAVAARMGRSHANVLHHFGSAARLQQELAVYLAGTVRASIATAVRAALCGEAGPRSVVDLVFDAFDAGGAGALAGWMLLTGNEDALDPVVEAIHALVDDLAREQAPAIAGAMHRDTMLLVLLALGDSLLGARLAGALGQPRDTARQIAADMLGAAMAEAGLGLPSAQGSGQPAGG